MGWGEQQSLGAQIGALRTQLEMAERKRDEAIAERDAALARAKAWRDVADAWEASVIAETDEELDAAVENIRAATAIADGLEP